MISHSFDKSTIPTTKDNARHTHNAALFKCFKDIRRLTRSGYAKKYILRRCLAGKLTGKNQVIPIVVANGGQYRTVHRQGFGGQGRSVARQLADKLGRQMLGVSCLAPIARDVYTAALLVALDNCSNSLGKPTETLLVGK